MSRAERRRAEREKPKDGEVSYGHEKYRGHRLDRWKVTVAGVSFWRVEVRALGLSKPDVPMVSVQEPASRCGLDAVTNEAKRVIGEMIFFGTERDVPAVTVAENYLAQAKDPLDALVMKTQTGRRSVCERHWEMAKNLTKSGTINPLVWNMRLTGAFLSKLRSDGILIQSPAPGPQRAYTLQMAIDAHAPICCFLGDQKVVDLFGEAAVVTILEAARRASL